MSKHSKKENTEIKKEEIKSTIVDRVTDVLKQKYGNNVFITPKDIEEMNKRIIAKNVIPTESISFNKMTWVGGLPMGRIFMLVGNPGCGKTTTSLACYKSASKEDYILMYADVEHRLDLGLLDSMKIDRSDQSKFILILPNSSDELFDAIDKYLQTGKKFFIILDSITALKHKLETKKEDGGWRVGARPGEHANDASEFLKIITPALSKSHSILFILSQYRTKDLMRRAYKGTSGGLAPAYYVTYDLEMKKPFSSDGDTGEIYRGEQQIGQELLLDFKKNSSGLPSTKRRIALRYGHGFYLEWELFKIGIQKLLIKKKGSWYSFKDLKIQGELEFADYIEDNKDVFNDIKKLVEIQDKFERLIINSIEYNIFQIFEVGEDNKLKQSTYKQFEQVFEKTSKEKKYFTYKYKDKIFNDMIQLVDELSNNKNLVEEILKEINQKKIEEETEQKKIEEKNKKK